MVATAALREALNQGISSGNFIDTKIILYSCRDPSGRVCRPKALYANSHVLKSIPYFDVQSQAQCFDEKIDEEEPAEGYEYLPDSDLEDEDETVVPPNNTSGPKPQQLDLPAASGDGPSCEDYKECIENGRVIKIRDVAFVTFHAFLVYIYTGEIEFAQFVSEEDNKSRSPEIANPSDDVVPLPSPKSIYRLADKYDVPVLKNLALDHIRGQLAKRDIVEESFSRFASRYDEIRDACIENLAYMLIEDSTMEKTRAGVRKKIDSFAEGELDHATEMLTTLWERVAKNRNIKAPVNPPSTNAPVVNPARWDSVNTALARSIRGGVFFDKKYWVRHSRARDILKPIYFPGAIMDDKAEQLRKLVEYIQGKNHLANNMEEEADVDSDLESDVPEARDELPQTEEGEEWSRAALIVGSFSTWKALLFYRCTDEILFAPLTSQGRDVRSDYIRGHTVAGTPPPCSPKRVYILANLLGIQPLCDRALADVRSKLTSDNVVGEVFSLVTAGQKEIMEAECELLISDFKDPKNIDLVKERIIRISDGSSPHCASALNLILDKALEVQKRNSEAKLRCTYSGCPWYGGHASLALVGQRINLCTMCINQGLNQHKLACAGCGRTRQGTETSCRTCERRFV